MTYTYVNSVYGACMSNEHVYFLLRICFIMLSMQGFKKSVLANLKNRTKSFNKASIVIAFAIITTLCMIYG